MSHDQIPAHKHITDSLAIPEIQIEEAVVDWLTHTADLNNSVTTICEALQMPINTYIHDCFEAHFEAEDRRVEVYTDNMVAIAIQALERRLTEDKEDDVEDEEDV